MLIKLALFISSNILNNLKFLIISRYRFVTLLQITNLAVSFENMDSLRQLIIG